MTGTQLNIFIHARENSPESQAHLNRNRKRFHRQCRTLIQEMLNGKVFTSLSAMEELKIMSPIRRFNDIIEAGVPVRYQWNTQKTFKEISIPENKREQVKKFIEQK